MAKPKKGSKSQKMLRRANSAKWGKARKGAKAARAETTKRAFARAKPKRATAKKAAPKQPVAPKIETPAVEVVELPTAPGGAV
jgi:sortase (surface protein transpeptidase)